jgi:uncharacterized protein
VALNSNDESSASRAPDPREPSADPGPTTESARVVSIDVLRGFAVLGILVMNIQSFSMPGAAYANPTAYGDLNGPNFWVWLISYVLAGQKMITIFSMLFGAGIVLMTERLEATGRPVLIHVRRMAWLILFGLLHAHLLWYGDVLYAYGVCGLGAYIFRRQRPAVLVIWAALLIAFAAANDVSYGISLQSAPPDVVAEVQRGWQPPPEAIAAELAAYRGGWLDQLPVRSGEAFYLETFAFFTLIGPDILGRMLLGMALYKLGVFSARRSRRFYLGLVGLGFLVGIPIVLYGVYRNVAAGWDVQYSVFIGSQFNNWASLLVALGWIGAVMLACQAVALAPLTRLLAAVGRIAFSNYILQTLICTTIFYGHGLGLFGRVDRVGQIAIVTAIWAAELVISPFWLARFRFGPLEWLWRSLTYRRIQPFGKR